MQSFEPTPLAEISDDQIREHYNALMEEFEHVQSMNDRLLRNLDRIKLSAEHEVETGMTVLTGVVLKKLKRRSVVVSSDDIVRFPSTNTALMTADEDGNITYKLEGPFDDNE